MRLLKNLSFCGSDTGYCFWNWEGSEMLKRKPLARLELFIAGSLEQLVPDDHVLTRVDRALDLGWLHKEVADCY